MYAQMIREELARQGRVGLDPALVEGWMRLGCGTLDGVGRSRLLREGGAGGAGAGRGAAGEGEGPADVGARGGAAAWKGISKAERSAEMKRRAAKRKPKEG